MDSSMPLLQHGQLLNSAPRSKIEAHQKQESHIRNCLSRLGMAMENKARLIKMD